MDQKIIAYRCTNIYIGKNQLKEFLNGVIQQLEYELGYQGIQDQDFELVNGLIKTGKKFAEQFAEQSKLTFQSVSGWFQTIGIGLEVTPSGDLIGISVLDIEKTSYIAMTDFETCLFTVIARFIDSQIMGVVEVDIFKFNNSNDHESGERFTKYRRWLLINGNAELATCCPNVLVSFKEDEVIVDDWIASKYFGFRVPSEKVGEYKFVPVKIVFEHKPRNQKPIVSGSELEPVIEIKRKQGWQIQKAVAYNSHSNQEGRRVLAVHLQMARKKLKKQSTPYKNQTIQIEIQEQVYSFEYIPEFGWKLESGS